MHIADVSAGNLGANGIVGGGIPLGVGAALGASIRGTRGVAVTFASDGASNNGVFAESLNLAGIWHLPYILVIENNRYAVSTPIEQSTLVCDIHRRGAGYGIESVCVDGNDVLKVLDCAARAVELCRAGKGPVLIEAQTYRHTGHHVNDPGLYMPKEALEYYKAKDPVDIGRKYLAEKGGLPEAEIAEIEAAVDAEVDEAVEFAVAAPEPSLDDFLREVG
jgi:pyruvate dehydrogenase E1 component alpha subunit